MPKQKKQSLTTVENGQLVAIWKLHDIHGDNACFHASAIARMQGGENSTYRKNSLKKLVQVGWLGIEKIAGSNYYYLTDMGKETLKVVTKAYMGDVQIRNRQRSF